MSNPSSTIVHPSQPSDSSTCSLSYEDSFLRLLREITRLQWVRESFPSHSKYYDGLQQKQQRLQKRIEKYLAPTKETDTSITMESLQHELQSIQEQIAVADDMLQDLLINKHELDAVCDELHSLYDEVVPAISDNPLFAGEQHLKREVTHLAHNIPHFESDIQGYQMAQKELHASLDCLDKAIKLLPGASRFLDRQAMVTRGIGTNDTFQQSMDLEVSAPTAKDADDLVQQAQSHVLRASKSCKDVSDIKSLAANQDMDVSSALKAYSALKHEIETLLRTRINPRFSQLQIQLSVSRCHYEQKTIEWTQQQINILETVLRENGALRNRSLDHEMAVLRMGSNAAIMTLSSEASGRVTVDDVLEVDTSEVETDRNGPLPVYSPDGGSSSAVVDSVAESSSSSGALHGDSSNHRNVQLPAYSSHQNDPSPQHASYDYDGHDQPPAYSL
ncbi:hypothetical protein LRAMOSA07034 [Lichtheimia ramosa]|uniref:Uncharacterized protein n=1 Tax=Lichtheimia ramosa TaxID=688394 RepID=A0A077WBW3_9FUNG|nr:hypothetical protein LRAMOSA07034 [Lichtheimia ramosa]